MVGRVNAAHVAGIIGVMPTLLELCGAPIPAAVQGRSLAPLIAGERAELADNVAFIETSSGEIGVRIPTHLYGTRLAEDLRTPVGEGACFFDLAADPYEQHNLVEAGSHRPLEAELRQRLLEWNREPRRMG